MIFVISFAAYQDFLKLIFKKNSSQNVLFLMIN